MSPAAIHHTEAVFSIVREIYGREHDDLMDDLDVNMAIWGIFMNATLRAAVHLGQDCEANLQYVKNHLFTLIQGVRLALGSLNFEPVFPCVLGIKIPCSWESPYEMEARNEGEKHQISIPFW